MKYIVGDLLEGNWDHAAHVCNVHKIMGSGVALFLRQKWCEVYQADLDTDDDGNKKLGTYSMAEIEDGRTVNNLYAMFGIGNDGTPLGRNCSYDNLYNALYKVCSDKSDELSAKLSNEKIRIGVPYKMGCDRAGGSWNVVESILKDMEEKFPLIEFDIYQLANPEINPKSSVKI